MQTAPEPGFQTPATTTATATAMGRDRVSEAGVDPVTAVEVQATGGRLASIDALRGIVMVLMVLDHTRDFFTDVRVDPMDPSTTMIPLYFSRWITHFCAPLFVFLAGSSAYLMRALGREPSAGALARFLASRGLFLMVMELTLVRLGLQFNWSLDGMFLQVIWVIGLSMVLLSVLVGLGLPPAWVGAVGAAIVLGHNLIDVLATPRAPTMPPPALPWWVTMTLRPGRIAIAEGVTWFVAYPLLPWFGIMGLGYAFGTVLARDRTTRIRWTAGLGLAASLAFLALRLVSPYGDPTPFHAGDTAVKSLMAFLNCQKYPPSLHYALMTLGPGLLVLAFLHATQAERVDAGTCRREVAGIARRALVTLGRVPLFYYLLQWPLLHLLTILVGILGGRPAPWTGAPFDAPFPAYSLSFTYLMWAIAVAILFLPCRRYAALKRRRKDLTWLSYL
jgi:uncharacterized membrane protein